LLSRVVNEPAVRDIGPVDSTVIPWCKIVCFSHFIVLWYLVNLHALLLQTASDKCHPLAIRSALDRSRGYRATHHSKGIPSTHLRCARSYTGEIIAHVDRNSISKDEIDIERAIVLALSDDFDVMSYPQAEKLGPLLRKRYAI
jgi:hypothetical protein